MSNSDIKQHKLRLPDRPKNYFTDPEREINVRVRRLWRAYEQWRTWQPELPGIEYERDRMAKALVDLHDECVNASKLTRLSLLCMIRMNHSLRAVPLHHFYSQANPNYDVS